MFAPLKKFLGSFLAVFGLIGMFVGISGFLDPVGSQMANDSAPFATPPSVWQSIFLISGCAVVSFFGIWLFRCSSKVRREQ